MNCREAIGVLGDFLEQVLGPDALAALDRHLAECAPCRAYLETYRKTVELTGRAEEVEMPDEMKERLRSFLLDELARGRR